MVYPHSYRTEHSETHTSNSVYGEYYAQEHSKKIRIQPELLKIIQYIDSNRANLLKTVGEAIRIKSISGDPQHKDDLQKMIDFTENWLSKLGLKYERFNIGSYDLNGQKVRLPTVLLASLGKSSTKKTLCIYVHLDVKKIDETEWKTDPWKATEENHRIFGCGIAQGKTNLMQWFHIIEAFQKTKTEIPVNLKFMIEGMYHHNSLGLGEFLVLRKQDFFVNIDTIILCDSEWIGEKHPCIIYGTVGTIHFDVVIEKCEESATEPSEDLENIFKEIVTEKEKILIPHFDDIVSQITPEEEKIYEGINDFNIDDVRESLPVFRQKWDKVKLLMHYWRLPGIWVGDTEHCNCETVSNVAKRHFILKIVPRQIVNRSINLTTTHINNVVKKLNIGNKVSIEVGLATRYWYENVAKACYQAARRAIIQIYKEDPSMIREDRARVNLTILDRVLENDILLLPLVSRGSNAGAANENTTVRNFYESTKLLAAFLFQLAK